MAAYDIKLTDQSQTAQNPYSGTQFGSLWGGGQQFSFGGINDSPLPPRVIYAIVAAVVIVAAVWLWKRRGRG